MKVCRVLQTMDALGGATPIPTNMAGGGRAVQRETLKAFGLSHGRFSTPGCWSATSVGMCLKFETLSAGLEKPVRTVRSEMNIINHEGARRLRVSVENEIERLIGLLDAMEPDPDLEPYLADTYGTDLEGDDGFLGESDLEPSLGWTANGQHGENANAFSHWGDGELDKADDEPSLGSLEWHPASFEAPYGRSGVLRHCSARSQENWGDSAKYDGEDDAGENGEPDVDAEHELGWQNEDSQAVLQFGTRRCGRI